MDTRVEVRSGEGGVDAYTFATELADALAGFARRSGFKADVDASVRTAITVLTPAPS